MELRKQIEIAKIIAKTGNCHLLNCDNCFFDTYCNDRPDIGIRAWMYDNNISKDDSLSDLLQRNYKAVEARGLINTQTTDLDFHIKMIEEINEVYDDFLSNSPALKRELTDLICVCVNRLIHMGEDPVKLLIENAENNERRAKNGK